MDLAGTVLLRTLAIAGVSHHKAREMADHYDMIVIGGGSGGLAASKRASKHGKKVFVSLMNDDCCRLISLCCSQPHLKPLFLMMLSAESQTLIPLVTLSCRCAS